MKREDIEKKFNGAITLVKGKIEASPLPSVGYALLIGFISGIVPQLLLPLIILGALVLFLLWLFADSDSDKDSTFPPQHSDGN